MSIPDANHPIWSILRVALLVITLGLVLEFNYNSGFDPIKDPRAMIIVGILAGGYDYLKRRLTAKE